MFVKNRNLNSNSLNDVSLIFSIVDEYTKSNSDILENVAI